MKKVFVLVLVLLLLCSAGCTQNPDLPKNETATPNVDGSDKSTSNTIADNTHDDSIVKPQFDENAPLFVCQDRSNIEGDRDTIYYYNYKGDLLNSTESTQIGFYAKNGLAPAYDSLTGLIGFVNESGVFVIEPQWDDAAAFSDDGIALVILEEENEEGWSEEKYGFINEKGEQIAPCIYDDATSFYPCGLAIIGVDKEEEYTYTDDEGNVQKDVMTVIRWGVIDKDGKVIIEPQFNHIEHITGEYIFCTSEEGYVIYDLSGNVINECSYYIDETHSYYYEMNQGQLYRYIREQNLTGPITSENISDYYSFTEIKIFDGKQFVDISYDDKPYIRHERVATTSSGLGYGVWQPGEKRGDEGTVLIPYEYDQLIQYGSFYVGIKYRNGDKDNQVLDIYNKDFEKTAENLEYNFYLYRTDLVGENIVLPDGYFQVYYYDDDIRETVCGILDSNGQIIVPLLYYRPIRLFTYEGVGGKFVY